MCGSVLDVYISTSGVLLLYNNDTILYKNEWIHDQMCLIRMQYLDF